MPIAAQCSHCGKQYSVSSKFAGKKVLCKGCGKSFGIVAIPDAPRPAGTANATLSSPTKKEICPSCKQSMDAAAILCMKCGFNRKSKQSIKVELGNEPTKQRRSQNTRRIVGIGAVALLVVAGSLVLWKAISRGSTQGKLPFTISRETTAITGPLRADGTVDYLAAQNEKYGKGVTPENNGFVDYLQVEGTGDDVISLGVRDRFLQLCGTVDTKGVAVEEFTNEGIGDQASALTVNEMQKAMGSIWKSAEHPQVAKYLRTHEKSLEMISKAAGKSGWWIPAVSASPGKPELASNALPALAPVRGWAEALCARALFRAGTGDFDGFASDVIAAKRLGRKVGSGSTLIDRLIGTAIDAQASMTIGAGMGRGTWNQQQCQSLRQSLSKLGPQPDMPAALDTGERWGMLDAITFMALQKSGTMGKGNGAGFDTIDQTKMHYDVALKLANALYDDLEGAIHASSLNEVRARTAEVNRRAETWTREREQRNGGGLAPDPHESDEAYSQRVGKAIVATLAPDIGRAEELYRWGREQESLLTPLLAAAEFRAKAGVWPKTLGDLVPAYLERTPSDPFSASGGDVRYVLGADGIWLYSVGSNGRDDGGLMDGENGKDDLGVGVK